MRKLVTMLIATAPVVVADSYVGAEPTPPSATDIVRQRVAADLPSHLGLLECELPEALAKRDIRERQLQLDWQRAPRLGSMRAKLVVTLDNDERRVFYARLRIGERAAVLVANKSIKAGQTISADDLAVKHRTVKRGGGWRISAKVLVGSRALRAVASGKEIEDGDIEAPAPVSRGSKIRVEVHKGRLRVATRGILERQARPGELARIRLEPTRRLVSARLTGPSSAILVERR